MRVAITNIGRIVSGNWRAPFAAGDTIVCADGRISKVGTASAAEVEACDVVIDAGGVTAIPGLIDSHVHITFGDYTPRQRTVGYLESYLHGGVTTAISASEVHTPGRPKDPDGVKALAVAAQRCFADYRPGGVTVHAGSVILEPGLTRADFDELKAQGVWLAKAGFGAFGAPLDYVPVARAARAAGLIVTCHTGGGSIPGSLDRIDATAVIAMEAHVSFHVNGGPTAMAPEGNERIVVEGGEIALQLAMAGNLRSALDICRLAREHDRVDRLLVSTDTPTGTGVVPLGMLHLMAELVSLEGLTAEQAVAAATGSVGRVYGLDAGLLEVGRPADLLVLDAPLGSAGEDWAGALQVGDMPALCAALTAGEVRYTRSRNTPAPKRPVRG